MLPESLAAMTEELGQLGNPSSLHNAGRRARRVVEESREQIAEAYGARPSEVVFTSGGTEADNLAVKGMFWARRAADPRRLRVLTPAIEHHAVLDCVAWLGEHEGAQVGWLPPDGAGLIHPEALRELIARDADAVALVSVMWANNEVGTVQPVADLAAVAREHQIPFHSDAVQAAGQLPVDLADSGASALTITAHKIGGPVGVGALLLARGVDLVPVLHGGGQERDLRSGTLDAPAIRAFAVAVQVAAAARRDEEKRLAALRDDLIAQVLAAVPDAILNGAPPGPCRLPGNAHFSFPGCEGDALLMLWTPPEQSSARPWTGPAAPPADAARLAAVPQQPPPTGEGHLVPVVGVPGAPPPDPPGLSAHAGASGWPVEAFWLGWGAPCAGNSRTKVTPTRLRVS